MFDVSWGASTREEVLSLWAFAKGIARGLLKLGCTVLLLVEVVHEVPLVSSDGVRAVLAIPEIVGVFFMLFYHCAIKTRMSRRSAVLARPLRRSAGVVIA